MSVSAQLGIRGSTSFDSNVRPQNYRELLLMENPNGDLPITAISATQPSKQVTDDFIFHWFEKELPTMAGTVASVYVDSGVGTEYVQVTHQATSGITGATVYAKVAEAVADEFRVGYLAALVDLEDSDIEVVGKVVSVTKNGASSVIGVKLRMADPGGAAPATSLATVDYIMNVGASQAEGAEMPDPISYDPTTYTSHTGIFEAPLSITRTAKATRLRTVPQYQEAKREAREIMGMLLEKAVLRSRLYTGTGDNGQPEHSPMGIVEYISTYSPANHIVDYRTITTFNGEDFSGQTWEQGGERFLDLAMEQLHRYGSNSRLGVGGSGAMLGINTIAKKSAHINVEPGSTIGFGMKTSRFFGQHGEWDLMQHALFTQTAVDRNSLLLYEPRNLMVRYIDDVFFKADKAFRNGGFSSVDALKESYMAELGWEFHFPRTWMWIRGVGQDNSN